MLPPTGRFIGSYDDFRLICFRYAESVGVVLNVSINRPLKLEELSCNIHNCSFNITLSATTNEELNIITSNLSHNHNITSKEKVENSNKMRKKVNTLRDRREKNKDYEIYGLKKEKDLKSEREAERSKPLGRNCRTSIGPSSPNKSVRGSPSKQSPDKQKKKEKETLNEKRRVLEGNDENENENEDVDSDEDDDVIILNKPLNIPLSPKLPLSPQPSSSKKLSSPFRSLSIESEETKYKEGLKARRKELEEVEDVRQFSSGRLFNLDNNAQASSSRVRMGYILNEVNKQPSPNLFEMESSSSSASTSTSNSTVVSSPNSRSLTRDEIYDILFSISISNQSKNYSNLQAKKLFEDGLIVRVDLIKLFLSSEVDLGERLKGMSWQDNLSSDLIEKLSVDKMKDGHDSTVKAIMRD